MNPTETPQPFTQDQLNYRQPRCTVGTAVLWYRNGLRDRTVVEVGYMLQCGERTSVISTSGGRRVDAVRYIDDPKLMLSPEQRENGAWDFTDDFRDRIETKQVLKKWIDDVERRLDKLEEGLTIGASKAKGKKAGKAPAHLERYRQLRAKAAQLGMKLQQKVSADELQRLVDAEEAKKQNPADQTNE